MEVILNATKEQAGLRAARLIANQIRSKPNSVLGLATGSSPEGMYQELIRIHQEEGLSFAQVTTFNLDEYIGLEPTHPQSYRATMQQLLFDHVDLPAEQTHVPNGMATDIEVECASYEQRILDADGIDVQVLGIGTDGHIGFNEQTSSLASRTRIKTLTPQTLADNARFFGSTEEVPHHVITMGIGTILKTKRIVLLAFGSGKADAVAGMVEGPITASNPASALQLHEHTHVFLDEEAAGKLERNEYYRWVYEHKPDWQL